MDKARINQGNLGVEGVTRQAFEGFFCKCGYDAFMELSRRMVDSGVAAPGAFGANQRIKCASCGTMYTFRDGKWIENRHVILPPREPRPDRVAAPESTVRPGARTATKSPAKTRRMVTTVKATRHRR